MQAGETFNVIPESVELGYLRSFDPGVGHHRGTADHARYANHAFGLNAEIDYRRGYRKRNIGAGRRSGTSGRR